MSLAVGTRLGPYEIVARLGAGGMGEVYRALDPRLGRDIAIKVLPESVAADAERLARFEREARTVAALSHVNILAIFDVGREGSVAYAVTELLEGETLRELLSTGALARRKAIDCAVQVARGLAAAHEKGIVHRDLKPDNVFVMRDGAVKILDFGLARLAATNAAPNETRSPTVTAYTEPGTVMGTVGYMSPEQVRGHAADARSDIFSFGTLLYEMLTGRRAFQRDTAAETMTAILKNEPPEVSDSGASLPRALDQILRHCLEKNPESRFQSARDLAFALESLTVPSGAVEAARERHDPIAGRLRTRERLIRAAVGAFLAGAIGLFWASGHRSRIGTPALRFTIPPPAGSSFQGMPALSPDGSRLAFVATTSDGRDLLWMRALDSLEARALEGTEGATFPFWSPDGRHVAFFAQGKLKRIDASGGSLQILCDVADPRGGSWGSAGVIVFSANTGGEIERVAESGGRPTRLPHLAARPGMSTSRWPSFLPDGTHFLYFAPGGDPRTSGIHVASLDSKETTRLASADGGAIYAAPGYVLYRSGDRLMGQRFDAARRLLTGEAFPVIEQIWWDGAATTATAVSTSDTGLLACQTGGATASRLLLYDRSGRELQAIGPAGPYWEPTLSPDARWLAVARMEPEGLGAGIWVIDVERGSFIRVSSRAVIASTPLWSSDGRRIVFSNYPSGEVYVRDAQGAGEERLLFKWPSFAPLDDWSSDGRLLFLEVLDWPKFHFDVWVRDLESGRSRPVLQAAFNQMGARLSPDGRWLAYQSEESGTPEIFVRSFPEARERRQVSTGGGTQPRWRADRKELFYVSPDRKIMAVDLRTEPLLEAGAPHALFQTQILPTIEARNHYDVTADGQRFVVNSRRPEDAVLPITVVVNWASGLAKK